MGKKPKKTTANSGKKTAVNEKKKKEKEKPNQPYFKRTCFGKHRLTENCTKGDDPSCLGLVLFRLNPPAEVCLPRRRGQLYSTTLGNMR